MNRNWNVALRAKASDTLEVAVYDVIGRDFWTGEGITSKDFLDKLRTAPEAKKIELRVNSIGGLVDEAKAMLNLLAERQGKGAKIEAHVDGIAASSVSFLLTVADRVVMPSNAFQMLHGVRAGARGTVDMVESAAKLMRRTNEQLAEAYAAASERRGKGKTKADFLAAFAAGDLYLNADEAIKWGLADEKVEAVKMAACLADLSALDEEQRGVLPEPLRAAPYVQLAAQLEPPPQPAPPTPPSPVARAEQEPPNGEEKKTMKMISLASIVALLGMAADSPDADDENKVLGELKKKLAAPPPAEPSVAVSGVKLLGVATEAEAGAKLQELQRTQLAVLGATGKATTEEAMSALLTWKTKAEQTDQLTQQVAQLTEKHRVAARDAAIEKCGREGTLPPSRHEWARQQFATAEQVETFCAGMPKGFFNSITEPTSPSAAVSLTDEERQICKLTGVSEEKFLEQKKLDRNRAGAQAGV